MHAPIGLTCVYESRVDRLSPTLPFRYLPAWNSQDPRRTESGTHRTLPDMSDIFIPVRDTCTMNRKRSKENFISFSTISLSREIHDLSPPLKTVRFSFYFIFIEFFFLTENSLILFLLQIYHAGVRSARQRGLEHETASGSNFKSLDFFHYFFFNMNTFDRGFDFDRPAARRRRRLPGSPGPRPVQRLHRADSRRCLSWSTLGVARSCENPSKRPLLGTL